MVNYNKDDRIFEQNADTIGGSWISGGEAVRRADEVNMYQWLDNNYKKSGIFSSQEAMQNYINSGQGNKQTFTKIIQGKGYEIDTVNTKRANLLNIGKRYDPGVVANRPGIDVSEIDLLTRRVKYYQMKAYTSNNIPDLHNTPKDVTIVTNAEKVKAVANKGYVDVEAFETAEEISKRTQKRMNQIKNGKVYTKHTLASTLGSAAVSGLGGAVVGSAIEAVNSHRAYKDGEISAGEYAGEILKSGAQAGTTAAITTVAAIPVAAALATAGLSSMPVMIPLTIVGSNLIDKAIAPIFKRGVYKESLDEVYHTQSTLMNPMSRLVSTSMHSAQNTCDFVNCISANFEASERNLSESQRLLNESIDILNRLNGGAIA